jgi:hypothetical protein
MIGFIAPYTFTQFGRTGNTALSLFYTLSSSPLQTHYGSRSSIVLFWQRIYHSLTVNFKSQVVFFALPNSFLATSVAANSEDSTRLLVYTPCYSIRLMTRPFYKPLARIPRKTPPSIVNDACLLVRYLAMDVLPLLAYTTRECVYRVVA